MNKEELHYLLRKYNVSPRKEQGQNFLLDDGVVDSSVEAAELTREDTVLEIGPGLGALTLALAEHAGQVIAVEQDHGLFKAMKKVANSHENVTILYDDIRTVNLEHAGLQDKHYKLVANLPYSLTSWILRQFTEHKPRPSMMVVMVQKEVAERVVAEPGEMSILANAVQLYTNADIVREVPYTSFEPQPAVDSAILKLVLRETPQSDDPEAFMRLVNIGFSSKRKQLHNNLQAGYQMRSNEARALLEDIGLREDIRPQDLSIGDWEALRRALP